MKQWLHSKTSVCMKFRTLKHCFCESETRFLPPSSARTSPMPARAENRSSPTKSNEMPQQQPRKGKQQENGHEEKVTAIHNKTTTRDHAEHRRICAPNWDLNCRSSFSAPIFKEVRVISSSLPRSSKPYSGKTLPFQTADTREREN